MSVLSSRVLKMVHIRSLTPLRGLAAMAVVMSHFTPEFFPSITQRFYLGVDVFFMLSGFVMAHVYGATFENAVSWRDVGKFFWARFVRLYPLYIITLIVLMPFMGQNRFTLEDLIDNLLMIQSPWFRLGTWYIHNWSVSAEWHAYFIFPFVAYLLKRCTLKQKIAIAFGMLVANWMLVHYRGSENIAHSPLVFLRLYPEFFIGIFLYQLYESNWGISIWKSNWTLLAIVLAMFAAFQVSDFWVVTLWYPLMLCLVHNKTKVSDAFNCKALTKLGDMSYSIYMFQVFPMVIFAVYPVSDFDQLVGIDLAAFLICGAMVAIGYTFNRRIEVPIHIWLKSLKFRRLQWIS
jgi:peptidoglycan/LPS O-acetylase OafA/YrhL